MTVSPILTSDHVPSALAQTSCSLQKLSVTSVIFTVIVVIEFQGFIGIGFSSHNLLDTSQVVMLEGEWVLLGVSIEGRGLNQSNHSHVG